MLTSAVEHSSSMINRRKRAVLVIGLCLVAFAALSRLDVPNLYGRREDDQRISFKLGGAKPMIDRLRERERQRKAGTKQAETERDVDAERRWGIGEGDGQRPAAVPQKQVNSQLVLLMDRPVVDDSNWPDYERNITRWKWRRNPKNITKIRDEMKAAGVDIHGRFVTSNATRREGDKMRAYLTKENITLTGLFTRHQDEMSPFAGKTYARCSVVGNSGLLINSDCGRAIDDADFVFRINVPELDPFIQDVGYKTNFTTLNPSIFKRKYNYFATKQLTDKFNKDMAQFQGLLMLPCFSDEAWVPVCGRALLRLAPTEGRRVAFGDPDQFSLIRDYWSAKGLSKYPSTGLYLATAAIELCDQVDLYGFWPFPDSSMPHVATHPVKYHYFDDLHMVRTHDMRAEFDQLTRLHKAGALRLHLRGCAVEVPAGRPKLRKEAAGGGGSVDGDTPRRNKTVKPAVATQPRAIDINKLWAK